MIRPVAFSQNTRACFELKTIQVHNERDNLITIPSMMCRNCRLTKNADHLIFKTLEKALEHYKEHHDVPFPDFDDPKQDILNTIKAFFST